jgi:hypothetical protein
MQSPVAGARSGVSSPCGSSAGRATPPSLLTASSPRLRQCSPTTPGALSPGASAAAAGRSRRHLQLELGAAADGLPSLPRSSMLCRSSATDAATSEPADSAGASPPQQQGDRNPDLLQQLRQSVHSPQQGQARAEALLTKLAASQVGAGPRHHRAPPAAPAPATHACQLL